MQRQHFEWNLGKWQTPYNDAAEWIRKQEELHKQRENQSWRAIDADEVTHAIKKSSLKRVSNNRVGGRRFEPCPNYHSGYLNHWVESAAFVITSASGKTL